MTNERITYTATMPDGTTDTRTSPTMEYTHAVIGEHPQHGWIACSWHTSEALAHKAVNSRYTSSAKRHVVAVTNEPATKKGREAKAARIAEIEAETDVNVLIKIVDQGKTWERVAARLRRTELEVAPVVSAKEFDERRQGEYGSENIDRGFPYDTPDRGHYCGLCGERGAHAFGECPVALPRYIETGSFAAPEPSPAFVEAQKEAEASIAEETDLDVLVALVDSGRPSVKKAARARWAQLAEQHAAAWTEARAERLRVALLLDQANEAEDAARRALEAFAAHGMRTFPEG